MSAPEFSETMNNEGRRTWSYTLTSCAEASGVPRVRMTTSWRNLIDREVDPEEEEEVL